MDCNKILTVLIPAYNMEGYLVKCCSSLIISENMDKIEILIVNDGSKDSTLKIARNFEQNYGGVFKVIDKENGNYGSCVNRGLFEAQGKFIKILDADDSFDNNNFNEYVKFLLTIDDDQNPLDMVLTDALIVDEKGNVGEKRNVAMEPERNFLISDISIEVFRWIGQHCITYRTEALRELKYFQTEGISYTDQEWVRLPLLNINNVVYYPQVLYLYLLGRNGQTMQREAFLKNYWMHIDIVINMLRFYEKNKNIYPVYNQNLVKGLLCQSIDNVYREYLLKDRNILDITELQKFEESIKEEFKEFYNLSNNIPVNKKIRFPYISYWRGKKRKYELVYTFYHLISLTKEK